MESPSVIPVASSAVSAYLNSVWLVTTVITNVPLKPSTPSITMDWPTTRFEFAYVAERVTVTTFEARAIADIVPPARIRLVTVVTPVSVSSWTAEESP